MDKTQYRANGTEIRRLEGPNFSELHFFFYIYKALVFHIVSSQISGGPRVTPSPLVGIQLSLCVGPAFFLGLLEKSPETSLFPRLSCSSESLENS